MHQHGERVGRVHLFSERRRRRGKRAWDRRLSSHALEFRDSRNYCGGHSHRPQRGLRRAFRKRLRRGAGGDEVERRSNAIRARNDGRVDRRLSGDDCYKWFDPLAMYPTIFREIRVFDHHDNRELSRVGARLHIASFNHARSRGRRLEAQNYMRLQVRQALGLNDNGLTFKI